MIKFFSKILSTVYGLQTPEKQAVDGSRKTVDFKKGFTLIELIIYMALLSAFLLVLTNIFIAILRVRTESQASSSAEQDGRFILSRLAYDINRATATSVSGTTLTLTIGGQTYTYAINSSKLQLTSPAGTDFLNSSGSTISGVSFQKIFNTTSVASTTPTFVQAKHNGNGPLITSITLQPDNAISAGNLLILNVISTGGVTSLIDNQSQAWTRRLTQTDGKRSQELWTAPVAAAGTRPIITITENGSGFVSASLVEYSGLVTTGNPIDVSSITFLVTSTGVSTTTAAATAGGELGLVLGAIDGSFDLVNHSGFIQRDNQVNQSGIVLAVAAAENPTLISSGATFTGTYDVNGFTTPMIMAVVFKASSSGPAPPPVASPEETIKIQFTVDSTTKRGTATESRAFMTTVGRRVR